MDLEQYFQHNPRVAIAFSGGVDSAYLLWAALHHGAQVKAYYAASAFQPAFEREDALRLAGELGAQLEILTPDVLAWDAIASNPKNRCYHCKKRMFTEIIAKAKADGFPVVLDGTNASDDAQDRPGMQALQELGVQSPLRLCGLSKQQIRLLSRQAGLFTHDKPAYACLATRIPTGEPITKEKLERTERAEARLYALGLRDFRVRLHGGAAKLQVREGDLEWVLQNREAITEELNQYYTGVLLDLEVRQ